MGGIENEHKNLTDKGSIRSKYLSMKKSESNSMIDIFMKQIDIYQDRIKVLEKQKPFWFQKEKLDEYNNKMNYLENKVMWLYSLIEKEVDFDMEIVTRIKIQK